MSLVYVTPCAPCKAQFHQWTEIPIAYILHYRQMSKWEVPEQSAAFLRNLLLASPCGAVTLDKEREKEKQA